ncbi:MAG: cytochrome c oxidase assembly protein [Propionicimonas sp.]|uniref:cytochrome c oxidase assembly protein n=1 Tax=Propionicimonas sp. TaxID=1955623 RepID=UPI003D12DCFF
MSEAAGAHASSRPSLVATGAIWVSAGLALACAVFVGLVLPTLPPLPGRLEADALTGLVSSVGDVVGRLAAMAALGLLAAVVAFVPPGPDGQLAPPAQRIAGWAGRAAQLWFVASLLMTFANPAFVTGIPLGYTMRPDIWADFLGSTPSSLAWLVSAVVALVTAVVAYRARSASAFAVCWLAGALAMVFIAVTGNVSVGLDHDWATDAAGVATLAGVVLASGAVGVVASALAGVGGTRAAVRYRRVSLPLLGLAAAGCAVVAWQQLAGESPFAVAAGAPVVAGVVLVVLLVANRLRPTRSDAGSLVSAVAIDVALLVLGVAALGAATHLPPPRFLVPQSSQVNYLGYEVDVPATAALVAGPGRPNLLWVLLALTAIGAYAWGVVRVHRAGGRWPVSRLLPWLGGWLLVLYLATSGLWMYSTAVFSWHMLLHMTVNMMVPVLCVLGAPFTLLEAASRERADASLPGPREVLAGLAANRFVRFLLSPPVVWVNYVASLFVVYFTPLFPWLMRYHWAHQVMLLHFMLAGYLFFGLLIGPDRHPWQLPYLVRFALLISVMPFHAIFAVGIMMARTVIGEEFYKTISVSWVGDLLADQNIAGQITWFTGEVPAFIAVIVLAAQWFRSDSREAAAADRRADTGEGEDELGAYNDMLAQLAERDREQGRTGGAR